MGRRDRLVNVDVHAIEAHLGGFDDPENRVQVGPVAVDQPAGLMHRGGDRTQLFFEQSECVRISQHQADNGVVQFCFQFGQVDIAVRVRGNRNRVKAAHGGGSRIGAVRRIWHEDLAALCVATVKVISTHHQHAGQLALRAGGRLQGRGLEASDRRQDVLQLEHDV